MTAALKGSAGKPNIYRRTIVVTEKSAKKTTGRDRRTEYGDSDDGQCTG